MTPEDSNQALISSLLCDRVRDLEDHLAKERRLKSEVLGRLEKVTQDKHSLETRVALLEAENASLRHHNAAIGASDVVRGESGRVAEAFGGVA